ncbi:trans-sulfuration enzyme family protein [Natranaerofaba carboxydovora]|uniref:trans-sulfuration enzyme family protein n=1 Tax=Natranaerofaba carboxydovora TaxID=2742683 RepID=UPI001F130EDC|nr:PLP-dependent aspartate aminotransferase family protein [Natranaerofaba carboxydovora]UMZ74478.1 Cystathionine gamma-lyase [Natranaerofaba carboxydovora]
MREEKELKLDTILARCGVNFDSKTGAISVPVYQSATFSHPSKGESTGYDYSRSLNPTREALEKTAAEIENASRAFAYSSGMAAITSILPLFRSNDHIIVSDDLYGGTYRLFDQVFSQFDLRVSYVPTDNLEEVEKNINKNTRAIFVETPTNPLMKITDLKAVNELAKSYDLMTIVDNTFLTPYFQKPIQLGADIVIHSATKYLGGHNDLVAGIVAVKDEKLGEKIEFLQNSIGAVLGPQDSWLLLRGLKTLGIRLDRQEQNAKEIAGWLDKHPLIEKVFYPGLPEHPGYEIMNKQAQGYGAMISFTVKDRSLVPKVLNKLNLISFAESLGGVESLITFPSEQTHGDIPKETREKIGITDELLRLSVGIEGVSDLIYDLEKALEGGKNQ